MTTNQNLLDAALQYAANGWHVFPITPKSKKPAMKSWPTMATTNPQRITSWWTNQFAGHGIGIATGTQSGIFALDVDVADGKQGDETLHQLEAQHGDLPDTLTSITGTGGTHHIYQTPPGVEIRNNASTRLGADLDIRGDGGYIVAPPTVHPNGQPYEWDLGEPNQPAQAPQWLIDLLTHQPEPEQKPKQKPETLDRPGDQWAANTTWSELLEPDGWTLSHIDNNGEHHWVRPGKHKRDGTSATTGYTANDTLKIFTSSMQHAGLEPESVYTKLGYIAATRHGGDHSAAASWCRQQGYGTDGNIDLADIVDLDTFRHNDDGNDDKTLKPIVDRPPLPAWPIEVLPDWMADYIQAAANSHLTPVDLPAQMALGALSAICMGTVNVQIPTVGWTEPTNLYLWCAMPTGSGKSPIEKAIAGPLREWELKQRDNTAENYRLQKAQWRITQKQAKEAEQSVTIGSKTFEDVSHLIVAAGEPEPQPYRLTVDDVSPQVLVQQLGKHQQLAMISAEGGIFDTVAGQFGKGSGTASIDVFLKAWSGDMIQRDRVGGDAGPESVTIERPLLTMALAIQPSVIEQYQATSPELRSRGFFARFMPSIPRHKQGYRTLQTKSDRDMQLEQQWRQHFHQIADNIQQTGGLMLSLDPTATQLFTHWHDETERLTREHQRLHPLAGMLPKIRSSVLRTAAILAVADGQTVTIDTATMARAITIGEYWIVHALELERTSNPLDQMDEQTIQTALRIIEWMKRRYYKKGETEWRPTDVMRGAFQTEKRHGFGVDLLAEGFALLEQKGWLRFTSGDANQIGTQRSVVNAILTERAYAEFNETTQSGKPTTESGLKASNMLLTLSGEKQQNLSKTPQTQGSPPTTPEKSINDALIESELLEYF